jgi:hypothetical protein
MSLNFDGRKFVLNHSFLACHDSDSYPLAFYIQEITAFVSRKLPTFEEVQGFGYWIHFLIKHIFYECTQLSPPITYHMISNMCSELLGLFSKNDEQLGTVLVHVLWGMLRANPLSTPPDFASAYQSAKLPPCDPIVLHSCSELIRLVCQNRFESVQSLVLRMLSDLIGFKMKPCKHCDYKALALIYGHLKELDPATCAIQKQARKLLNFGERFHTICFMEKAISIISEEVDSVIKHKRNCDRRKSFYPEFIDSLGVPSHESISLPNSHLRHSKSSLQVPSLNHSVEKDSTDQVLKKETSVEIKSGSRNELLKEAEELLRTLHSTRQSEQELPMGDDIASIGKVKDITQEIYELEKDPKISAQDMEMKVEDLKTTTVQTKNDHLTEALESSSLPPLFVSPGTDIVGNSYSSSVQSLMSATQLGVPPLDNRMPVEDFVFNEMTVPDDKPHHGRDENRSRLESREQDSILPQDVFVAEGVPSSNPKERLMNDNHPSATSTQSLQQDQIPDELNSAADPDPLNSISSIRPAYSSNENPDQSSASISFSNVLQDQDFPPESVLVAQLSSISTPFMKKTVQAGIQALLRHLIFSFGEIVVNYFDVYSEGLLCGKLRSVRHNRNDIENSVIHQGLHPILREVIALDPSLLIELLQDWELPAFSVLLDENVQLFDWLRGLDSLHRHLLPLSKSILKLEEKVKKRVSVAEALILVKDRISIVRLAIQGAFSTENLQRIHSNLSLNHLDRSQSYSRLGKLDNRSMVAGSMMSLPATIIEWIQILLE